MKWVTEQVGERVLMNILSYFLNFEPYEYMSLKLKLKSQFRERQRGERNRDAYRDSHSK